MNPSKPLFTHRSSNSQRNIALPTFSYSHFTPRQEAHHKTNFPMPATINLSVAVSSVRFSSSGDTPTSSSGFRRRTPIRAVVSQATTTAAAGSLYEVLRVEHNASPTEIKSAFRSLAKQYHPDVAVRRRPELDGGGGDGDGDFIEIRNAYETLSDPSARAMYDLSLIGRRRRLSRPLGREQSCSGYYPTRRWETDQCW